MQNSQSNKFLLKWLDFALNNSKYSFLNCIVIAFFYLIFPRLLRPISFVISCLPAFLPYLPFFPFSFFTSLFLSFLTCQLPSSLFTIYLQYFLAGFLLSLVPSVFIFFLTCLHPSLLISLPTYFLSFLHPFFSHFIPSLPTNFRPSFLTLYFLPIYSFLPLFLIGPIYWLTSSFVPCLLKVPHSFLLSILLSAL